MTCGPATQQRRGVVSVNSAERVRRRVGRFERAGDQRRPDRFRRANGPLGRNDRRAPAVRGLGFETALASSAAWR